MKKLTLPDRFILQLTNTKETGMGYHVVNIMLNNSKILRDRKILNSTYLVLEDGEKLSADDIEIIYV